MAEPDLFASFLNAFPQEAVNTRIEVGLSGGLDSVVLLHLLARAGAYHTFDLSAVHVHHGLSEHADEWSEFCKHYCAQLGVPLRSCAVQIERKGLGIEAAARQARYRVYAESAASIIALAHQRDDQIETFMLAVLRGGGIRALAAMPVWRPLDERKLLWRPLLDFGREALAAYAREHGLSCVEDESNGSTKFLRNWLRLEGLPDWRQQVPHLDSHILSNIDTLQQDLAVLNEIAAEDYAAVCGAGRFDVARWRMFGEARRLRILQTFVQQYRQRVMTRGALRDLAQVLMSAQQGRWDWGDYTAVYYRDILFLLESTLWKSLPWCAENGIRGRLKELLSDCGLVWKPHAQGLPESVLQENVMVRAAVGSDVIRLAGGSKPVKKVLQERHILPPVRGYWPIITNEAGECLAVANLCVATNQRAVHGFLPVFPEWEQYILELKCQNKV